MRKYILLFLLAVAASGCVAVAAGGIGAGATYTIVAGSVSDNVDAKVPQVVDTFINVIKDNGGEILFASISEGEVRAEMDKISYTLTTKKLTENSTKYTITARKSYDLLPARDEAIKIYTEMAERLK